MGFYGELFTSGGSCIGCGNGRDYDRWLKEMQNRHAGRSVPLQIRADGILLNCGGRVGYAAEILRQGLILAKGAGFDRFLAVCDKDNLASEKVILKNGGASGKTSAATRKNRSS